ncbi:hypothetical protein [Chitinophaga rhizosphaerae]|uniref:hypothetical protein n=1 Tax=Chitinophaga rhizosphaerae TaxID=1864947 RepID=UPI000F80F3FA|nr:hypothetical protein [Chitinophaga rhizosphaerae]
MIKFLERKLDRKRNWVTFRGALLPASPIHLDTFLSSLDVSRLCREQIFGMDQKAAPNERIPFYTAIPNLLSELRYLQTGTLKEMVPPRIVREQLDEKGLLFMLPNKNLDLICRLALGDVAQAFKELLVIPAATISGYQVVLHSFYDPTLPSKHQGHFVEKMRATVSMEKAKDAFLKAADGLVQPNRGRTQDLYLIGAYRGETLELDELGKPLRNTGIIIGAKKSGSAAVSMLDINEPQTAIQTFFVRHDPPTGTLITLGDRLQPVEPGARLSGFASDEFAETVHSEFEVVARRQLLPGRDQSAQRFKDGEQLSTGQRK